VSRSVKLKIYINIKKKNSNSKLKIINDKNIKTYQPSYDKNDSDGLSFF